VKELATGKRRRAFVFAVIAAIVVFALIAAAVVLTQSRQVSQSQPNQPVETNAVPSSGASTSASTVSVPTADPTVAENFESANVSCNKGTQFNSDPSQEAMLVEDGGRSLTLMSGAQSDLSVFECVADKIALPDEVRQSIETKQSQPDERSVNWNDMTATWTFNPNTGLDLYITAQQ